MVNGGVLLGLLDEGVHIGDRGFQPLQLLLLRGDGRLQLLLLGVVVGGEHPELLVGHPPQYIVLVEPLEQSAQFSVPAAHGVQLLLYPVDLPPQLQRVLLVDVLRELPLLHPGEVGHPAQIIQYDLDQLFFPDVVGRTLRFSPLAIGVALEVVAGLGHGTGPVQYHRLSTVDAEHETGEQIWLVHVLGNALFVLADILHDVPLFLGYQRFVGMLHQHLLALRPSDDLFILVGQRRGAQAGHMPQVDLAVQDTRDRAAAPCVWTGGIQPLVGFSGFPVVIICRRQNLIRRKDAGNLVGAFAGGT